MGEYMIASGVNGKIEFDGTTISITRKVPLEWLLGVYGISGSKSLTIDQVTVLLFRESSTLLPGWLQIGQVGVTPPRGGKELFSDPNTVAFENKNAPSFIEMRDAIQDALNARKSSAEQSPNSTSSTTEELIKLKGLLDSGLIEREEFDALKREILGK
jgi:hypothetical protein